ncbi:unnamed protein product [Sphagnum balticum]
MVAVRVCVNYVNRLDVHQRMSLTSDANRKIVHDFMTQVEKELLSNLPPCPSFATTGQLRNALIARYGRRFDEDTPSSSANSANVTDDDENYVLVFGRYFKQIVCGIKFTITPKSLASELRDRIEFVVGADESTASKKSVNEDSANGSCSSSNTPSELATNDAVILPGTPTIDTTSLDMYAPLKRITPNVSVVASSVYTPIVALRHSGDIQVYNMHTRAHHCMPIAKQAQAVRSVCVHGYEMIVGKPLWSVIDHLGIQFCNRPNVTITGHSNATRHSICHVCYSIRVHWTLIPKTLSTTYKCGECSIPTSRTQSEFIEWMDTPPISVLAVPVDGMNCVSVRQMCPKYG